ncbi:MAG: TIGR01777 family protein [Bacteroidetes bacterium]|nr:TIGR01777 family protein [Bacteroidota bacterium]
MKTVVISGGTGLVGRYLSKKLKQKDYHVSILSRIQKHDTHISSIAWQSDKQTIDSEAIANADYIINLSGANISQQRWSKKRKQLIIDSRVTTIASLFENVKQTNPNLKAFISASAIGYYGSITSSKVFTETDAPADDFLGETCRQWEQAADKFETSGIRTVKIRTGVVLTSEGGALAKMIIPVKIGIASAIGSGKQYLPWIHIDDLCGIYIKAIEDNQMSGAYNAVAPEHQTNKEFTLTLAQTLNKPFWYFNIPAIAMKILFGEMSAILLKGSRISSGKIQTAGYQFIFPTLKSALKDLCLAKQNN